MLHDLRIEPVFLTRDGVRLAHFEAGPRAPKSPPLLLINGWTGDHGIFTPQIAHFAKAAGWSPLIYAVMAQATRPSRDTHYQGSLMTLPGNAASWNCKNR